VIGVIDPADKGAKVGNNTTFPAGQASPVLSCLTSLFFARDADVSGRPHAGSRASSACSVDSPSVWEHHRCEAVWDSGMGGCQRSWGSVADLPGSAPHILPKCGPRLAQRLCRLSPRRSCFDRDNLTHVQRHREICPHRHRAHAPLPACEVSYRFLFPMISERQALNRNRRIEMDLRNTRKCCLCCGSSRQSNMCKSESIDRRQRLTPSGQSFAWLWSSVACHFREEQVDVN
jgi:hypothetical protein